MEEHRTEPPIPEDEQQTEQTTPKDDRAARLETARQLAWACSIIPVVVMFLATFSSQHNAGTEGAVAIIILTPMFLVYMLLLRVVLSPCFYLLGKRSLHPLLRVPFALPPVLALVIMVFWVYNMATFRDVHGERAMEYYLSQQEERSQQADAQEQPGG